MGAAPEAASEEVPPELIRTMAYAATKGIPLSDLETFDEWQERLKAESPGQDLKISFGQVNYRRTVIGQFTPSEIETVSKARQSGLLTRLQREPEFLMLHVNEEADLARRRALDQSKRLAE